MTDTNNENLDSTNEELDEQDQLVITESEPSYEDSDDVKALKEKNRQLFARAKKAEGWIQKEGTWVKKPEPSKEPPKEPPKEPIKPEVDVNKLVDEKLFERDVEGLDVPDDIKSEVKNYAKLHNVSIKKALDSTYIKFRLEEAAKQKKNEEASLGAKGKAGTKVDFNQVNIEEIDITTEEGKKQWDEYQKWLKSQ